MATHKREPKAYLGVDSVTLSEGVKRKNRTLTEMEKLKIYNLADKGISATKIATVLDVSKTTVVKYLKKAEESRIVF